MIVGYARTSTTDQEAGYEAQQRDLKVIGCTKVFHEQVSSVAPRAQLEAALEFVREGDTLVCTKPCRIARSTADLLAIRARLKVKGVKLIVQSISRDPLDDSSPTGTLIATVLGAVAQFEREMMLERQREGIAKAKQDGKYKGRQPTARRQAAEVMRLRAEGVQPSDIAKRLGVGRASVYRIMAEAGPAAEARQRM